MTWTCGTRLRWCSHGSGGIILWLRYCRCMGLVSGRERKGGKGGWFGENLCFENLGEGIRSVPVHFRGLVQLPPRGACAAMEHAVVLPKLPRRTPAIDLLCKCSLI